MTPYRDIVRILKTETIRSRVGYLLAGLTGSTLAKVWALESLRYGLRPPETVRPFTHRYSDGDGVGMLLSVALVVRNWLVAAKRS